MHIEGEQAQQEVIASPASGFFFYYGGGRGGWVGLCSFKGTVAREGCFLYNSNPELRIQDVHSRSDFFLSRIPDPNFSIPDPSVADP